MYPPGHYPPVPVYPPVPGYPPVSGYPPVPGYPTVSGYPHYPRMPPLPNIPMPNGMINAYNQRFPQAPYMWYPQAAPNFLMPPQQVPSSSQGQNQWPQMHHAPAVQHPKAQKPEKIMVERSHPVWDYFELWKEPGAPFSEATADCKLCGWRIPRVTTSSAKGHLCVQHLAEFMKVCEAEPGHRHHYGPFGRPRAVPTTVEMKGQGSRTENAMLQSTRVFHPAMDEYKIQEYVNLAPINAQQFEANNLPAINSKPFDHVNLPGVSIRPFEPANFNMRPFLFNEPTNYLPANTKHLGPTSPLPNDTKQFEPNSLSTVNTRLFDPAILPPVNTNIFERANFAPVNTALFEPANPAPIQIKPFARPDLLCNDKKLLAHNLPPIDTKSFGESKPRSSVQMSPISMDSPASPRFFKIEAKLEAEETDRKTDPKMEDRETEKLLKMFTKRHDGLYECVLCTFCSSYDLNAFRAHQDTTHRVQRYKPNPPSQNEGLMPGFVSSL